MRTCGGHIAGFCRLSINALAATGKRKKPNSGKLGIRRDHPRRWIEMKSCVVGGLQEVVLRFEFHQNWLSDFGDVGGRNLPFPLDWVPI